MAECYEIAFRDRYGAHRGYKWGEGPAAALAYMKKSHAGNGEVNYEKPVPLDPQPFSAEAREVAAALYRPVI